MKKSIEKAYYVATKSSTFDQPIIAVKSGRYGDYGVRTGFNRSEKYLINELGYVRTMLTGEELEAKQSEFSKINSQRFQETREMKLRERADQVNICLAAAPIAIYQKDGQICATADLAGTPMIEAYHGCGKGTAYIADNKVIAFHYGYDMPDNAPRNAESKEVMMSCTQICF